MFNALKTIAAELKRANDLKEKELDLKILGPNDFEKKWGQYIMWPVSSYSHPIVVHSSESGNTSRPAGVWNDTAGGGGWR